MTSLVPPVVRPQYRPSEMRRVKALVTDARLSSAVVGSAHDRLAPMPLRLLTLRAR
jgi:hypothetical protein